MEPGLVRPILETLLDDFIGKFGNLAAFLADREGSQPVGMVVRMGAGDKGIQTFPPLDKPALEQLLQRPVDLQRRAESVVPELVMDGRGAERRARAGQGIEDKRLVSGQVSRAHAFGSSLCSA